MEQHKDRETESASRRARVFTNGRSQAIRLPKEFRFSGREVRVRKEGKAVILEPLQKSKWPAGYWRTIERRRNALDLGRTLPLGGKLLDLGAEDV